MTFPIGLFNLHDRCMGILGFFANVLLLYMAVKRTSPAFRSYAHMIIVACVNDLIYSVVSLACGRVIELRNATLFHMGYGLEDKVRPHLSMFIEFMNEVICMQTTMILPTQYYFRYILVSKKREPTIKLLAILVFCSTLLSVIFGVTDVFSALDSFKRGRDHYVKQLGAEWIAADGYVHFTSANDIRDFSTKFHFGCGTIWIWVSYSLVTYYGYKTLVLMQNPVPHQQLSKNAKAMTKQFTRNLLIQTCLTICCAVLPATFIFIYVMFQPPFPYIGIFISSIYTWNPLSNAIVTMLVIRPYREQLFRLATMGRWSKKGTGALRGDFTSKNSLHKTAPSDNFTG